MEEQGEIPHASYIGITFVLVLLSGGSACAQHGHQECKAL